MGQCLTEWVWDMVSLEKQVLCVVVSAILLEIMISMKKRMAKQAEFNNRMRKESGQREIRPLWNNVQRVNHQNQFIPKVVLTKTGKIQVNTSRTS
ncbi:hypothetical protein Tco_0338667, partial [Tanacetum coccineum]